MAAPKGNKNAQGKKTGRKSAFQEQADAQWLADAFFNEKDIEKIRAKIESGKFSLAQMLVYKAMNENKTKELLAVFAKLFPDVVQGQLTKKILILDVDEEL